MRKPRRPDAAPLAEFAELAGPLDTTLPDGFTVELADDVHRSRDGRLMLGGSPPRLLRLSAPATRLLGPGQFTVAGAATAALARQLIDTGVALPRPAAQPVHDLTIVIPARDRVHLLHRLLTALRADPETAGVPVLVVDDGSVNPAAVAAVTRRHGATLLAHPRNQGPAAARNTGLRHATTGYIAFCDSDLRPAAGWLSPLLAQFTDPALALAAPRVVGIPTAQPGWLDRYEDVRSPLDMGGRAGPVVPRSALAYVPGAALVVRRAAVGAGFSPDLRTGEDVDLCLRLHRAGWRMRYLPSSRVGHLHRAWPSQLARAASQLRVRGGGTGLAAPRPGAATERACLVGRRVCAGAPRAAGPGRCGRGPDGLCSATPDPPDTGRGHPRAGWHAADAGGRARQRRTTDRLHDQALLAGGRTRGLAEPAGPARAGRLRRDRGADRLPAARSEPEPPRFPGDPAPGRHGLWRWCLAWRTTPAHLGPPGPAARPADGTPSSLAARAITRGGRPAVTCG